MHERTPSLLEVTAQGRHAPRLGTERRRDLRPTYHWASRKSTLGLCREIASRSVRDAVRVVACVRLAASPARRCGGQKGEDLIKTSRLLVLAAVVLASTTSPFVNAAKTKPDALSMTLVGRNDPGKPGIQRRRMGVLNNPRSLTGNYRARLHSRPASKIIKRARQLGRCVHPATKPSSCSAVMRCDESAVAGAVGVDDRQADVDR